MEEEPTVRAGQGRGGRIVSTTYRLGVAGLVHDHYFCDRLFDASQNGAGALVDYCSYGAAAFSHLFGLPKAVQAVAARLVKQDIPVDDNAAITLIYDNCFAFAEASWSQIPSYHDAVYWGSTGTLWTEEGTIWVANVDGQKTQIPVDPLPVGERNGPECFLN